jgi:hypothetical protein
MKIKIMPALVLSIAFLFQASCLGGGCGSDDEKAPPPPTPFQQAQHLLYEAGIDPNTLRVNGGDWSVAYEAGDATSYDNQITAVWAGAFGILAYFATDTVTIVNTVAGEPVATLRAKVDDIKDFNRGVIDEQKFKSKIVIIGADYP